MLEVVLSEVDERVLECVREHVKNKGIAPTHREIALDCEFSSFAMPTIHLLRLERAGYLRLIPRTSRGIVVLRWD